MTRKTIKKEGNENASKQQSKNKASGGGVKAKTKYHVVLMRSTSLRFVLVSSISFHLYFSAPRRLKHRLSCFAACFFYCGAKRPNYKQLKIEVHMLIKQKMALMVIHRQLVKKGYFLLAQAVLQHLAGIQKHWSDVNFLLRQFHFSNLI